MGRMRIFFESVEEIEKHNARFQAGEESFEMKVNMFSDMLASEVAATMNGFKKSDKIEATADFVKLEPEVAATLPKKVDWRKENLVTDVKNQGQCGSCWAFSTTGSFEGQHAKKTGKLVSLSEQQLVDCSKSNYGCQGGLMDKAFAYIKTIGGLESESDYPYTATTNDCKFDKSKVVAQLTGFVDVTSGDEEALKEAVATVGPIAVAIDASNWSFQMYSSGIYYEPECSTEYLDHGVLVVGYGTTNGKDYWLVKNSWGPSWGLSGYIKMSRNRKNNCGIATMASYPTV